VCVALHDFMRGPITAVTKQINKFFKKVLDAFAYSFYESNVIYLNSFKAFVFR